MSRKRILNELVSEEAGDNIGNSKKKRRNDTAKSMGINVEKNDTDNRTQARKKATIAGTVS